MAFKSLTGGQKQIFFEVTENSEHTQKPPLS